MPGGPRSIRSAAHSNAPCRRSSPICRKCRSGVTRRRTARMREPGFWWRKAGPLSALLSPLGALYGAVAGPRMARKGARAGVPVVCIGNFTLGGAGKTPTAIAVAQMLATAGEHVFFLTRGYGGNDAGPRRVDAHADTASQVGDEALLLARAAPTIVSRDRVAG